MEHFGTLCNVVEQCGILWNILENFGNCIVKWKKRRGKGGGEDGRKGEKKELICMEK